jgi:hypothetical protein
VARDLENSSNNTGIAVDLARFEFMVVKEIYNLRFGLLSPKVYRPTSPSQQNPKLCHILSRRVIGS